MDQLKVIKKVKEYAKEKNISSFHIYRAITEYADEITLENLSSVLVGGTFLREKELIISILPFIKSNYKP